MTFVIKSARSDAALTFVGYDGDYFLVELGGSELSAVRRIWGYTDCDLLVDLLNHLSKQERGWEEPAEWQSIEHDFTLRFRSDSHGHVFVDVELRRWHGEEDWKLETTIQTELGQLPKLAAEATTFFQKG